MTRRLVVLFSVVLAVAAVAPATAYAASTPDYQFDTGGGANVPPGWLCADDDDIGNTFFGADGSVWQCTEVEGRPRWVMTRGPQCIIEPGVLAGRFD